MDNQITTRELAENAGAILDRIMAHGVAVTIMHNGKAAARLEPIAGTPQGQAESPPLGALSEDALMELVNEEIQAYRRERRQPPPTC